MNNNFNANNNKLTKEKALAVGMFATCLLATSLGAGASSTWLGLSVMTVGILGIGLLIGFDIGKKTGRKERVTA